MENNLRLLGMAKKAGRLEIGEEPVGASARARKAKVLLLAADAAANTARRAAHFADAGKVLLVTTPYTKAQLGGAVGRTSCAMMALTDAGFAAAFTGKLAAQAPETYGAQAQSLEEKAEKVLQRQREQRQHEKNLERGKKRPWFLVTPKEKPRTGETPAGRPGEGAPARLAGTFSGKPYGKPAGKPGERPAGRPAGKPGEKPTARPQGTFAGKPGERPPARPAGTFGGKPYGRPTPTSVGQPARPPAGRPGEGAPARPVGTFGGKPYGKPAPTSAGRPARKPAGKPAGKSKS